MTSINNGLGASYISVGANSTFALRITGNNTLSGASGFTNNGGKVIFSAGANLANGNYTVASQNGLNFGDVLTYGGTYANNIFTVVKQNMTSAQIAQSPVVISDARTIVVTDGGQTMQISTSSDASASNEITINNIAVGDSSASDFEGYIIMNGDTEISAWEFDVVGISEESTVSLSFYTGDMLDLEQVSILFKSGGVSANITDTLYNLTYADGYLSFIAGVVIPEPSEIALLIGLAALGFVSYRRRK